MLAVAGRFTRLGLRQRVALLTLATTIALACSAAASRAADYQDANHNVCEGVDASLGSACFNANLVTHDARDNVAMGASMMNALTSGSDNVAFDFGALSSDTTGSYNLASGFDALDSNTTGSDNLASGSNALGSNTTGSDNLASGSYALYSNTNGSDNLASGY